MKSTHRIAAALGTGALIIGATVGAADAATVLDKVVIRDPHGPAPTCNVTKLVAKKVRVDGRRVLVARGTYQRFPARNNLSVIGLRPDGHIDWQVSWNEGVGSSAVVSRHGHKDLLVGRAVRVAAAARTVTMRVPWRLLLASVPRTVKFVETDPDKPCHDVGTSHGRLG